MPFLKIKNNNKNRIKILYEGQLNIYSFNNIIDKNKS